jgi:hypothetical protein
VGSAISAGPNNESQSEVAQARRAPRRAIRTARNARSGAGLAFAPCSPSPRGQDARLSRAARRGSTYRLLGARYAKGSSRTDRRRARPRISRPVSPIAGSGASPAVGQARCTRRSGSEGHRCLRSTPSAGVCPPPAFRAFDPADRSVPSLRSVVQRASLRGVRSCGSGSRYAVRAWWRR